eukprot:3172238-Karenia_brevis.AAC.1
MFPSRQTLEVEDVLCKPAIRAFSFGSGKLDSTHRGMAQRPFDSAQRLPCVSNQGPMRLRQLGLPVHRER